MTDDQMLRAAVVGGANGLAFLLGSLWWRRHRRAKAGSGDHASAAYKLGQGVARGASPLGPLGRKLAAIMVGALGAGLCLVGVLLIIVGPGTLGYQAIRWLRDGNWTPLEFRLAWQFIGCADPIFPHWRGVQEILVWLLDQPLSVGLLVFGVATAMVGLVIVIETDRFISNTDRAGKTRAGH